MNAEFADARGLAGRIRGKLGAMQLHRIRTPADQARPVLVDRQARVVRYLRISLTDRCNLRCTYCMPDGGIDHVPRDELLSYEEVVEIAKSFVAWGVERVRLTGGEPTVRRDLPELVARLSALELAPEARRPGRTHLQVAMTTNAERLPELARPLFDAGLRHLNISLDTLERERFAQIARRDVLPRVLEGIDAARAAGFEDIKINSVAVRGFNDDEFGALCRFAWARGATPRFIEVMPMAAGRLYVPGELIGAAEIRDRIAAQLGGSWEAETLEVGREGRGYGPARYWRANSAEGAKGGSMAKQRRFGVISPMTENFCDSCNRLRISATGQLQACLARDDAGDLKSALRAGGPTALEGVVRRVLGAKQDRHGFEENGAGGPQKAMISIGG